MKKVLSVLLVSATMLISPVANASLSNSNPIHEYVMTGYEVGYAIDSNTVLGSDMHMWSFDRLVEGWYVAYSLENNNYYYISQDAAQEFLIKR